MPNATVRANARTLSKATKQPDDALLAQAELCAVAARRYEAARAVLEEAEERYVEIKPPPELIKTEDDAKLRLFISRRRRPGV
jgi:hypothetical protein